MEIVKYKKKFRKQKIIKIKNKFLGCIQFGYYGIKAVSSGTLYIKQTDNIRLLFAKIANKTGNIIFRVFFRHPLTSKPLLSRMGKGYGSIKKWISYIKPGNIIIEISGINFKVALLFFSKIYFLLPFKIQFITRDIFHYKNSINSSNG